MIPASEETIEKLKALGLHGSQASLETSGYDRRLTLAKAGMSHQGHRHFIDHYTVIDSGAVSVEIDGSVTEHRVGAIIFIAKDKWHKFTALEDNTSYRCVFDRPANGQYIDEESAQRKIAECSNCNGCAILKP